MTNNRAKSVTAYNLFDDQVAMIAQEGKDRGTNRSAALRDILDEWLQMKAAAADIRQMNGLKLSEV